MMRYIIIGLLLCSLACNPFEKVRDVSDMVPLSGRCVRLRQRMSLVDSGGDKLAQNYLSKAAHTSGIVGEVPAGSEIHVDKVFLVKSFEDTQVKVIGMVGNEPAPVSLTQLFHLRWRQGIRASLARGGDQSKYDVATALDPDLAEWCGSGAR